MGKSWVSFFVFRDISERKKSEAALQETSQHLKASVSNLHGSIVLMGESGIVMANQAYCDYFGLQDSPDDLIGLTPQEIQKKIKNAYLHPDEQLSRIQEIIEEDKPVIGEEIAMKGGRYMPSRLYPHRQGRKNIWSLMGPHRHNWTEEGRRRKWPGFLPFPL